LRRKAMMWNTWRLRILALGAMFIAGMLLSSEVSDWRLSAAVPEGEHPKFFQLLGHQQVGRNLVLSVYCDADRGHLLYTYTLAGGDVPSGTVAVIRDGCKKK
jgi:hypothetical protein